MPSLTAGTRLGRYEIRAPLGAGGMAEVYLADDTQLGRRVALKVLPPEDQANEQARRRLQREARAAAMLDHPHICAVYEVGEAEGLVFIATQYIEGQTLAARLAKGPLELPETLAIAAQVADALAEAHEKGVLHRDIKPANIMLTARGQAKVMDFGLAKLGRPGGAGGAEADTVSLLSTSGAIMGTVPYMSPEQVRGADLDRRSDLFSMGIVLYEMVSGRRPFDEPTSAATASAILTRDPQPVARFAASVPPELERIVAKALRKDPEERYQSAKDLLVDLRALRDEQAFQVRLERTTPSTDRPPSAPATASSSANTVVTPPGRVYAWLAGAVVLAIATGGGWWLKQRADVRWAEAQLPQIAELAEARRHFEAYDLAVAVEPYLPGHPTIAGLMPAISDTLSATSDPPGAAVYLQRFAPTEDGRLPERRHVGTTPLTNARIARGEYILSLEKDGYAPAERTVSGVSIRVGQLEITPPPIQVTMRLAPAGDVPGGMAFVPGSPYRLVGWARPTDRRVELDGYLIGKYEVSNEQFREFITGGGYVKREYWAHAFVRDGRTLSWEEAMAQFVDRTGLPGPREWSNQQVPPGRADHPVTGVTWYEAAAYAAFRGKRLPTVFEWEKAARDGNATMASVSIMPWGPFQGEGLALRANFGTGTAPVTSAPFGMSRFGAYNMAGNVAEWTANDSSEGYLATGGAWGDPLYTFAQYGGRPGFFSSSKLGFRLAQSAGGATGDQGRARIEISREIPVFTRTPVSAFTPLAAKYRYEPTPLDARVEETMTTPDWKRETISFVGAGGQRATAYLYLPHHVTGPLQVLHFVPAGDVEGGLRSLPESIQDRMTPFVTLGRAVFAVVLEGYLGRIPPGGLPRLDVGTVEYFERIASRVTDLRRGLDYLETRPDIDRTRIAFFGPSAGAQLGLITTAVETRYRAVVMIGAGLPRGVAAVIGGANPVHFAPHIRGPKLIVQGRYDEDIHVASEAEPLFTLLSEPKRFVVFEGGHVPTTDVMLTAAGPWLNEVMGPVVR